MQEQWAPFTENPIGALGWGGFGTPTAGYGGYAKGGAIKSLTDKYGIGFNREAVKSSVKRLVDKYGLQHYAENTDDPNNIGASGEVSGLPEDSALVSDKSAPYRMTPQIADVMQRNRAQQEKYNAMLDQSLNSPELAKIGDSEKYLRLASAFFAPTRTGAFTENLGLAAAQMGDINKSQREAALSSLQLKLAAQKLRVEAGRDELQALRGAYPMATPGQVMANTNAEKRLALDAAKEERRVQEKTAEAQAKVTAAEELAKAKKAATGLSPEQRDLGMANINRMDEINDILNQRGAIKGGNAAKTMGGDMAAGLLASPTLQQVQGFFSGDDQKLRDEYDSRKNVMMQVYKKSFNIGSRELDTPAEQALARKVFGDTNLPYEYNKSALNSFKPMLQPPQSGESTAKPASGPKKISFESWK